jgi:hypothetical protein
LDTFTDGTPALFRDTFLSFSRQVEAGEGRVITCLQDHVEEEGFPPTCYDALKQHTAAQQKRLVLNYHANKTCAKDVTKLCPRLEAAVQQGGVGDVACLVRSCAPHGLFLLLPTQHNISLQHRALRPPRGVVTLAEAGANVRRAGLGGRR